MEKAVDAVIEGKMGYMLAAKTFSVPQTTLEIKVKASRENLAASSSASIKVPLGPKRPIFTEDEEKELCSYIIDMESRLYGLTTKDLKALAYNLAVKNNKPHPFNVQKQEAGKDWVQGFLNRHPELSIRKPESTSAARAAGFNKVVDQFYTFWVISMMNIILHQTAFTTATKLAFQLYLKPNQNYSEKRPKTSRGLNFCGTRCYDYS
ncbi:hypothetical protein EVAR_99886_1 [Eumeta japonica]|uniref:HTH CENPB-type domain-containing protein n=1 Tax=Eumeta variegata TaxID=151549 RepID=A0A4C1ZE07_EUMVA|nr:hypothetical protein EVAR_99886_1 [Eumeta japonica]